MNLPSASQLPAGHLLPPSLRRMLAAQAVALLVGFPLALMIIFPVGAAFDSLRRAGFDPRALGYFNSFAIYFVQAIALAFVQSLLIRRAIARRAEWIVASGLLGVILLPLLFPLTTRLSLGPILPSPLLTAQTIPWQVIVMSAGVGGLFGGVLGFIQTFWMCAGQRRWVVVSFLSWGLVWAILFPVVYSVLYLHR